MNLATTAQECTIERVSIAELIDKVRQTTAISDDLFAIIVIEATAFPRIHARFGYRRAGQLLDSLRSRFQQALRPVDEIVQTGDHTFVAIIRQLRNPGHAILAGKKFLRICEPEVLPSSNKHEPLYGHAGIALYPEHGADPADLLQQAQIALEVAKESGKDLVTADDDSVRCMKDGWQMRDELAHAVRDSDLELHYQPKIDLKTNEICGVEALMRWFSPTFGQVPPARFFAVAEGTDLLTPMTRYALNAALRCAVLWRRDGNDIGIAVNLPTSLLLDVELVDMIRSLLSIWDIPASLLTLEITEGSMMADIEASFATMNRLKELGVRISIDDFGTGYSSFSYFQSIPADELKIDRTFVAGMTTNRADRHLVETMLNLAHRFRLTVVAEGIEDEATLTALRDAGCDIGQGFHIARPMPQAKFDAWLDARIMEQLVAQQDDSAG